MFFPSLSDIYDCFSMQLSGMVKIVANCKKLESDILPLKNLKKKPALSMIDDITIIVKY